MNRPSLEVVSDGSRLSAGIVVPESPRAAVLLLHGLPSVSPSDPNDPGYPGLAERFAEQGYAAAWVDLRSVRESEGFFSIEGWVRDVRATVDAIRRLPGLDAVPFVLVGSSAGGAVSTEAVRRGAPVDLLALLAAPATWVNYADGAQEAVDKIRNEAGLALAPEVLAAPDVWAAEFGAVDTEVAIAEIEIPVLIVHGTADDVVPMEHAERIAENASNAEVVLLEGALHQLRKEPRAVDAVLKWIDTRVG